MERLTKETNDILVWYPNNNTGLPEYVTKNNPYREICEKLKAYEDLEEQGRLFILPCAVGDTVWQIHTLPRTNRKIIAEVKADAFFITLCTLEGRFGKTVFLTREEAESALEKMKGEDHE